VDDQHAVVDLHRYQLEEVSGPVSAGHEVTRRIVTEFGPGDGVRVGVLDVGIEDLMPTGRAMDLHTQ
jgi:hypothetical protein